MIVSLKMNASGKNFDKISLKAIRDTFSSNMWSVIKKVKVQTFWLAGRPSTQFPPLVGYPDLPVRKTLRRVIDLLIVMILKRVSKSIFY